MNLAPIVIFCFDRPYHLEKLLNSLKLNVELKDSIIYVFQDGYKEGRNKENWEAVSKIIHEKLQGYSYTLITHEQNLGCHSNIPNGISYVLQKHETVIVIEDDLVVSPSFLSYMNWALTYFYNVEDIGTINAFNFKIPNLPNYFFIKGSNPWGWATWKRSWLLFNANNEDLVNQLQAKKLEEDIEYGRTIDILKSGYTWDVNWYASLFLNNKLSLYPNQSFTLQTGFDLSGTHKHPDISNEIQFSYAELNQFTDTSFIKLLPIQENREAKKTHKHFFFKLNNKPFTAQEKRAVKFNLFKHFIKTKIFRLA